MTLIRFLLMSFLKRCSCSAVFVWPSPHNACAWKYEKRTYIQNLTLTWSSGYACLKKKEIQHNTWYLVWLSGTIACEFWIVITFYIWESDFALLPRQICLPLGFLKRMFLVNICKSLFTVTLLKFGQKSLIRFIITKWAFFLNTYVACYAVMYLKKNP